MRSTASAPAVAEVGPPRIVRRDESFDFALALLNILEDSAGEQQQLRDTQSAVLNILDDAAEEKTHLQDTQSAVLNILEDFGYEKERQVGTEKAILNILDDFSDEKNHLEQMKSAVLNILEDLGVEKERLQEAQNGLVRSEGAIRESLLEKETLLKEIHHRVKNNLQVIISLLRLQARYLRDKQALAMFEESQNRVYSISLVHEMLYRAGDLARVDVGEYLRDLTRHLSDSWRIAGQSIEIIVESAGVQVAVDVAVPCGLIVNELVTNALKHAFPDGVSGSVHIGVVWDAEEWLRLTVRDNGIGLPADFDFRRPKSLGLELVATLVRQLRAKIHINRNPGTEFMIDFQPPLPAAELKHAQ